MPLSSRQRDELTGQVTVVAVAMRSLQQELWAAVPFERPITAAIAEVCEGLNHVLRALGYAEVDAATRKEEQTHRLFEKALATICDLRAQVASLEAGSTESEGENEHASRTGDSGGAGTGRAGSDRA